MSFKEQVERDIYNVFLNLDEFAELHRVEGKEIPVVVDNDMLNKYKEGQILGVVKADMLLMGKETDFPRDMDPGRLLNVDGREMKVEDCGRDIGLIEVALSQSRSS